MAAVETKRLAARAVMAMTLFMAISFTLDRASRRTCRLSAEVTPPFLPAAHLPQRGRARLRARKQVQGSKLPKMR